MPEVFHHFIEGLGQFANLIPALSASDMMGKITFRNLSGRISQDSQGPCQGYGNHNGADHGKKDAEGNPHQQFPLHMAHCQIGAGFVLLHNGSQPQSFGESTGAEHSAAVRSHPYHFHRDAAMLPGHPLPCNADQFVCVEIRIGRIKNLVSSGINQSDDEIGFSETPDARPNTSEAYSGGKCGRSAESFLIQKKKYIDEPDIGGFQICRIADKKLILFGQGPNFRNVRPQFQRTGGGQRLRKFIFHNQKRFFNPFHGYLERYDITYVSHSLGQQGNFFIPVQVFTFQSLPDHAKRLQPADAEIINILADLCCHCDKIVLCRAFQFIPGNLNHAPARHTERDQGKNQGKNKQFDSQTHELLFALFDIRNVFMPSLSV